ncbi:MAG: hypothetical protein ACW975_02570 [Candidatus Thorarchaeota archaeon]|jgi:hypothetical protein
MNLNMVQSTPSEAWNQKLPPIGFSVDYSGTSMIAVKFPETDYYLRLSRPPRGSLEFIVKSYRNRNHNHNILRELVHGFSLKIGPIVDMGKTSMIRIGEIDRRAREFVTGSGLSRKKWKAALIPSPDGGPYGLLVMFGLYIGSSRDGKRVKITEHPVFKMLMGSLQITNSR